VKEVLRLLSTDVARVIMELVRLVVDVFNWFDERRRRREPVMMMECEAIHCYQCNKPTGAYLASKESELVPVIVCSECVELDPEEDEDQALTTESEALTTESE
jgi:hypothetical protein